MSSVQSRAIQDWGALLAMAVVTGRALSENGVVKEDITLVDVPDELYQAYDSRSQHKLRNARGKKLFVDIVTRVIQDEKKLELYVIKPLINALNETAQALKNMIRAVARSA